MWKVVDDCVPHRFNIHPVIAMPKPVADSADIVPRKARTQTVRICSESDGCLTDEQQLALDCGNRLRVFPKRPQIHAAREIDDHVNALEDISQGK